MYRKPISDDELRDVAKEIIEMIRPRHFAVCEIRTILRFAQEMLEYIVLRE